MRQIFTKAQLVVLWVAGIVVSLIFYTYDIEKYEYTTAMKPWTVTSFRIIPIVIITAILIVTLLPKKQY